MDNIEQTNALPAKEFPETVKPLILSIPRESRKRAQHNHKIIEALETELAAIRGNPVYRVLAWLNILPKGR